MDKKVKIELTEEQQLWLLKFLNREFDEEVEYQWHNQESDTTYLEDLADVYEALLGKTDCVFIAMSYEEDMKQKWQEIQKLKESNNATKNN